jgi:hypothetical protein
MMVIRHVVATFALLSACLLTGCGSLISVGASDAAGVAGAGAAASVTKNAATAAAIGIGAQSIALEGVHYLQRRVHRTEQQAIAVTAGPLDRGGVVNWAVSHSLPLEDNEHGQLTVSRVFGSGSLVCKEIVFSVVNKNRSEFYVATICWNGNSWAWATAEPAVARWGGLQ